MTREELDTLWQQALIAAVRDGEKYTRYHFAAMVAKAERDALLVDAERNRFRSGRNETDRPLPKTCGFSDVRKTTEGFVCSVCGQKMTDDWQWYAMSDVTHGKTSKARKVKP